MPIDLALGLLSSSLTAIAFIGVLWSIGGGLVIDGFGLTLAIPGYLVIAVIVYSILLTAAMMLIGRHLTRVMQENKRAEAELRAVGAHLRESGEGTASRHWRRIGRGDRTVAGIMLAAHADDARFAHKLSTDAGRWIASLNAEISCRSDGGRRP